MPRGIKDWPWRMPSRIQTSPNETRSSRRAGGLGARRGSTQGATAPGRRPGRPPVLRRPQDVPGRRHQSDDQQDQEALVQEGRLEGRDDRRVVRC